MLDIACIKNDKEFGTRDWDRMISLFSPEIKEKTARFRNWSDRQAHIMGKLLLRYLLDKNGFERNITEMTRFDEYKKPYIPGKGLHFNISHSGGYVICALSLIGTVGIDIEQIRPVNLDDFESFLSVADLYRINTAVSSLDEFYRVWVAKEAVMKADGRGLYVSPAEIVLHDDRAELENKRYAVHYFPVHADYIACIASPVPAPVRIMEICFDELYEGEKVK